MKQGKKPRTTGRPPKGEFHNKRAVFSTRITPELKASLVKAADRNGRSLSQEIERRLRNSLLKENFADKTISAFGGKESYALHKLSVMAREHVEFNTGKTWLDDAFTFDQTIRSTVAVWSDFAPTGNPNNPPDSYYTKINPENLSEVAAVSALARVATSDDLLSELAGDEEHGERTQTAIRIRDALGDVLVQRLKGNF